jgi:hypothetical protein
LRAGVAPTEVQRLRGALFRQLTCHLVACLISSGWSMSIFVIATISIASLLCPFALAYVWILRLWDTDGQKSRRAPLGWISLALVTSGVAVYWLSAFGSPPVATPEWDVYFHRWSRISIGVAALGFIFGIFGGGKERWVVLLVSFVVPLSWAMTKVLE